MLFLSLLFYGILYFHYDEIPLPQEIRFQYKPYDQGQAYLMPPQVDEVIPENHQVRLVSEVPAEMGIEKRLRKYRAGGWARWYHPPMMTQRVV